MEVEQILSYNRQIIVDNSVDNAVGKYSLEIGCYEKFLGLGLNNAKGKIFSITIGLQKQKCLK